MYNAGAMTLYTAAKEILPQNVLWFLSLPAHIVYKPIFTSCVSGRGYRIGPVCLCVCVCVRLLTLHHGKGTFRAKELYNTGRGRCGR